METRVLVPMHVDLPADFDAHRSYPMVILLHGRGGNPETMMALKALMGMEKAFWVAPQGPYPQGEGFRWFHPSDDPKVWSRSDPFAVEMVARAMRVMKDKYPISHVFLLGHSEGAGLAFMAGAQLAPEISGILGFGAGDPKSVLAEKDFAALKGMPIFLAHGQEDRVALFGKAQLAAGLFEKAGAKVTFQPYLGGHGLEQAPLKGAGGWILQISASKP
jgi:phospholipase/carboxylesterase